MSAEMAFSRLGVVPQITELGRQRQADLSVGGQPGLTGELQASQGYTVRCYLKIKLNIK